MRQSLTGYKTTRLVRHKYCPVIQASRTSTSWPGPITLELSLSTEHTCYSFGLGLQFIQPYGSFCAIPTRTIWSRVGVRLLRDIVEVIALRLGLRPRLKHVR